MFHQCIQSVRSSIVTISVEMFTTQNATLLQYLQCVLSLLKKQYGYIICSVFIPPDAIWLQYLQCLNSPRCIITTISAVLSLLKKQFGYNICCSSFLKTQYNYNISSAFTPQDTILLQYLRLQCLHSSRHICSAFTSKDTVKLQYLQWPYLWFLAQG